MLTNKEIKKLKRACKLSIKANDACVIFALETKQLIEDYNKCRGALRFYADEENYTLYELIETDEPLEQEWSSRVMVDNGAIARKAVGEKEG